MSPVSFHIQGSHRSTYATPTPIWIHSRDESACVSRLNLYQSLTHTWNHNIPSEIQ